MSLKDYINWERLNGLHNLNVHIVKVLIQLYLVGSSATSTSIHLPILQTQRL